jgi:hypothetical protein
VVMKWQNIFRYAQDIWAPMAAPIVVVFLAAALWKPANSRGALACIWLAIGTVPFTLLKGILADAGIHFLPPNLENPMVFSGAVSLVSMALMFHLAGNGSLGLALAKSLPATAVIAWTAIASPSAIAVLLIAGMVIALTLTITARRNAVEHLWDWSMCAREGNGPWFGNLWIWWLILAAILVGIYAWLW